MKKHAGRCGSFPLVKLLCPQDVSPSQDINECQPLRRLNWASLYMIFYWHFITEAWLAESLAIKLNLILNLLPLPGDQADVTGLKLLLNMVGLSCVANPHSGSLGWHSTGYLISINPGAAQKAPQKGQRHTYHLDNPRSLKDSSKELGTKSSHSLYSRTQWIWS